MLSKKLSAVAGLVAHATVADIGCDHALLPVYLVKTGKISRAIASDKNPSPLKRAKAAVLSHGLADYIELRLGSGLSVIKPGEAEACVIAGMGGMTIISIIRDNLLTAKSFKQLILSPERDVPSVRRFLHENGFQISDEIMVIENGIFYNIFDVSSGAEEPYSDLGYAFGQTLLEKKDVVLTAYIESDRVRLEQIFLSFEKSGKAPGAELLEYHALCAEALSLCLPTQEPPLPPFPSRS